MNLTKTEKIEIMKSAGYSEISASKALDIGVMFFESLDEIKESEEANNMELSSYDKGTLNGKEYYFVDTSII